MTLINKKLLEKLNTYKSENSIIVGVQLIKHVSNTGVYDQSSM